MNRLQDQNPQPSAVTQQKVIPREGLEVTVSFRLQGEELGSRRFEIDSTGQLSDGGSTDVTQPKPGSDMPLDAR